MLPHQGRQLLLHHVAPDQGEIGEVRHGLLQHRVQPPVQLHGHHLPGPLGQLPGQGADAGADLQHAGVLVRAAGGGNVPGHPALDEEVLAHGLGKVKAVALQKRLDVIAVAKVHIASYSTTNCIFLLNYS